MPDEKVPAELKLFLLRMLFHGAAPPEALWAGLLTRDPGASPSLAALMELEPAVDGYARLKLPSKTWAVLPEPARAESEGPLFRNAGTRPWPQVRFAFIATSEDNSGALVGWGTLRAPRTLMPGDSLRVPLKFEFG